MHTFRLYRRLMRTALLALLALGMVIGPTLAGASELHDMEHAAEVAEDAGDDAHAHAHPDLDHHGHHHGAPAPEPDPDPDHATGAHGLLHQASSASVTLPEAVLHVLVPSMSAPLLPELVRFDLPGDSPASPFRPPIA